MISPDIQFLVLLQTLVDYLLFADDWQEVGPCGDQGLDYDFQVALLILEGVALSPVVEFGDIVAHFLLDVTLLVKLLHLSAHPLEVHDAALARVAVI